MVEEAICIAKCDYTANQDIELTIHKNEKLVILDASQNWWRVRNDNQLCGYVPSNHVERVDKTKESFVDKLFKKKKKKSTVTLPKQTSSDGTVTTPLNILATAKFKYEATRDDELNLNKGDKLIVLEKKKDGWWKGEKDGQTGYFPSNYVSEGDVTPSPTTPSFVAAPSFNLPSNGISATPPRIAAPPPTRAPPTRAPATQSIFNTDEDWEFVCGVRAKDSHESNDTNDLSFVIGELMDIVKNPTDQPKWIARKSCGEIGYILRHMVDIVPNAIPVYFNPKANYTPPQPPDFPRLSHVVEPRTENYVSPFAAKPWYFGQMTRRSCDNLLMEAGSEGDFLIRDSESKVGDYSISMKATNKPKHFKVQLVDNQYAIGNRRFASMEEIIRHYMHKSPIFTSPSGEERLFLVKPLDAPHRKPAPPARDPKKEYLCAWEK